MLTNLTSNIVVPQNTLNKFYLSCIRLEQDTEGKIFFEAIAYPATNPSGTIIPDMSQKKVFKSNKFNTIVTQAETDVLTALTQLVKARMRL